MGGAECGEELDLGIGDKTNAPKKQFNLFNKAAKTAADLNAKIQQMGFIKETSVNELAARGVNLSLRDEIIRKLKEDEARRDEELRRKEEQQNQDAEEAKTLEVERATFALKQATLTSMVDKFCHEVKELAAAKITAKADVEMA